MPIGWSKKARLAALEARKRKHRRLFPRQGRKPSATEQTIVALRQWKAGSWYIMSPSRASFDRDPDQRYSVEYDRALWYRSLIRDLLQKSPPSTRDLLVYRGGSRKRNGLISVTMEPADAEWYIDPLSKGKPIPYVLRAGSKAVVLADYVPDDENELIVDGRDLVKP